MTHDEMIAVIQAHNEGKTIEYWDLTFKQGRWWPISNLGTSPWNFERYIYRIKPEPHYRQFKNAEEVMKALKEHGNYIKDGNTYRMLKKFTVMENGEIVYSFSGMKDREYRELPLRMIWTDGTPFGVKED